MVKNINTRMIMKIISLIWNFSQRFSGFRFYDQEKTQKKIKLKVFKIKMEDKRILIFIKNGVNKIKTVNNSDDPSTSRTRTNTS